MFEFAGYYKVVDSTLEDGWYTLIPHQGATKFAVVSSYIVLGAAIIPVSDYRPRATDLPRCTKEFLAMASSKLDSECAIPTDMRYDFYTPDWQMTIHQYPYKTDHWTWICDFENKPDPWADELILET